MSQSSSRSPRLLMRTSLAALVGTATLAVASSAQAQTAIAGSDPGTAGPSESSSGSRDEILVTAERRTENIQRVPISISAFSAATLNDRQIGNIEDIQRIAPSLQAGFNIGATQFVAIRGIGAQLYDLAAEPAVAVSQDGIVYTTQNSFNLDLFDVDRVEVLRGPQGTISGRNAIAGAINIYSKRPTATFEGGLTATAGNYERLALEGYLNGPLVGDTLMARIAARVDRDNGWLSNTLLNKKLGATDKLQLRASLLYRPTDTFEALLILDALRDRSSSFTLSSDVRVRPDTPTLFERYGIVPFNWDKKTAQLDDPGDFNISRYQPTLQLKWTLGPGTTLNSTTGYLRLRTRQSWDLDGTSLPILSWDLTKPNGFDVDQFSQELTLTSQLSNRVDLIAGGIYVQNHLQEHIHYGLPLVGLPVTTFDGDAHQRLRSWSAYAQLRYNLLTDLRFSAGVRYTHDTKSYDDRLATSGVNNRVGGKASWDAFTPRFSLDYAASRDLTVYATVSKGFKSGGFVTFSNPLNQFEPETVWNYETGLKADLLDRRLRMQLSGFYMDYSGLQQAVYGSSTGNVLTSQVVNAKKATVKGIELELDGHPTDALHLTFAGSWLHGRYGELQSADNIYPELGVRDLSGNRLVRAPEWQFNAAAEYTARLSSRWSATFSASYAWQSRIYFDFFNRTSVSQAAYGLINLNAALESADGRWRFGAYVKNLTDKLYWTHDNPVVFFGTPDSSISIGEPRRFGASVAYRF